MSRYEWGELVAVFCVFLCGVSVGLLIANDDDGEPDFQFRFHYESKPLEPTEEKP